MFCPVCGNEENEPIIVNGAKVCQKCGCVIEKVKNNEAKQNKVSGVLIVSIIAIILVFIIGVFVIGRLFGGLIGILFSIVLTLGILFFAVMKGKKK